MNQQVIESIKQTLHQHLPAGGHALLFGSQARGDAHANSDWDILIILNKDKLLPDDYDNVIDCIFAFTNLSHVKSNSHPSIAVKISNGGTHCSW